MLTFVAVAALALSACGGDDAASTPVPDPEPPPTAPPTTVTQPVELDGREFVSVSVEGYDLVEGTDIRLSFDDGSLSANAGCNTLSGGYTTSDGRLVVQQLATTEMACDMELMVQDRWLTDILSLEPIVEVEGDTLSMQGAGGAMLELVDRP